MPGILFCGCGDTYCHTKANSSPLNSPPNQLAPFGQLFITKQTILNVQKVFKIQD